MKIKARIEKMLSDSKVRAIASVSLDGQFVVKGLRIVDGNKGLFVTGPQSSFKDKDGKTKYQDLFFPISNAGKADLEKAVLDAYSQKLSETQNQTLDGGWHSQDGGILPFDM